MFRVVQRSLKWASAGPTDANISSVIRNTKIPQSQQTCRAISTTSTLFAEPPKKKRRIDPAVFKQRVERKIKKTEREIGKLEAEPRQLAPVLEYQLTNSDIRDLKARPEHNLKEFGVTPTAMLGAQRLWSLYRQEQARMEHRSIRKVEHAQAKALKHLKEMDQELYDNTVAVDDTVLIPYRSSHLKKETAPNPNYTPPDGYIKDISKEWVM